MSKQISLTKGYVAIVDDEDYEWLNQWKWTYTAGGYAVRGENKKGVYMHRSILNAPKGVIVDHVNRNKIDNRRENLRLCTQKENQANRKSVTGRSQYKGVIWRKDRNVWRAEIRINNKGIFLGHFENEEDAARRYDAAARTAWGSFALTNFTGQEVLDQRELEPKQGITSIYHGVGFDESRQKWRVQINIDGKNRFIGRFDDELSAAKAYDDAAFRYYGQFAKLNFAKDSTNE